MVVSEELESIASIDVANVKEFVEFWLQNSVHPDEQFGLRRGREGVQHLVDSLLRAAEGQGFNRAQIEAELGDPYEYIRASIDRQNATQNKSLGKDKK